MAIYGRDGETWERLTAIGLDFLIERARLKKVTSRRVIALPATPAT